MAWWAADTMFDNDSAMDLVMELERSSNVAPLAEIFEAARHDDYLDDEIASRALAGAELIAGLAGRPATNLPEDAGRWLKANAGLGYDHLVGDALAAVDRIGRASETRDLLGESELLDQWLAMVRDLTTRLNLVRAKQA